ncbi:nitrilase [Neolewinella xylanilytica]|uniref:Nitrilase n=1 Tax=Neolewinella xylanilytica TaxID=1514080 RepID=A0A2S6I8G3_9BACT|nr:carbon-nitrogen hydrolase family protein [Neolewinella xylanilytica]PPK87769.1 nitrilase [Neolewinella xylanilytica]
MPLSVALIQDSPVFFDKEATLEKLSDLASEQARAGAKLIVFPESFVPGYPRGFDFGAVVGSRTPAGRELYAAYHRASVDLESDDRPRLEKLARDLDAYLVIGVTERRRRNSSLYCSMLYLSPTHGLLGVHRKIKPTGTERLIWAEAGGEDLLTFDTAIGKMGGLICWENYMPLARAALYRQGVEIWIAPTADARDGWTATMQHIALEGRCFVLGCNHYMTEEMLPAEYRGLVREPERAESRGGSVIVSPLGEIIAGPLYGEAGVVTAELDPEAIVRARLDFDVAGHYARPDIFTLTVRDQPEQRVEGQ